VTIIYWVGGNVQCLLYSTLLWILFKKMGIPVSHFQLIGKRISNDNKKGNGHPYLIRMHERHCNNRGKTNCQKIMGHMFIHMWSMCNNK
jgi:hypothetical protein